MKLTLKELHRLRHFNIIRKEKKVYNLTPPLPDTTNEEAITTGYLAGFEDYYRPMGKYSYSFYGRRFVLKDEYAALSKKDRPRYQVTVEHPVYDVEPTDMGIEHLRDMYERYAKLTSAYADILAKCER